MSIDNSNIREWQRPPWLARTSVVAIALGLWFTTQSLIGARPTGSPDDDRVAGVMLTRGDGLFRATQPIHQYLQERPGVADGLLIASSAVIDALGLWLLVVSIFGSTMRPFIGLLLVFALRQLTQALCVLPAPEGMIWRSPGVPSLLVTYQVANDFFFSGHTAIAVFGATQLARLQHRKWLVLGVAIALFEAGTVICLRAHYTMDVLAGAVAALWAARLADRIAPSLDRYLLNCTAKKRQES